MINYTQAIMYCLTRYEKIRNVKHASKSIIYIYVIPQHLLLRYFSYLIHITLLSMTYYIIIEIPAIRTKKILIKSIKLQYAVSINYLSSVLIFKQSVFDKL